MSTGWLVVVVVGLVLAPGTALAVVLLVAAFLGERRERARERALARQGLDQLDAWLRAHQ